MNAGPAINALPPRWRRLLERVPQALAAEAVPSPCQSVCVMHASSGWCEGCLRSLDEIAAWSRMSAAERRGVWTDLPQRLRQQLSQHADPAGD